MRALALGLLLCSACAFGSAGLDSEGRPQVWGVAVLHAEIEACTPEGETCAKIDAQGLSEQAADTLQSQGFLSKLRELGSSAGGWLMRKGLGLIF